MSGRIEPGAWLGVLGAGQLGRMFIEAAHALGYRVCVLSPDPADAPAKQLADAHIEADYTDEAALARLCQQVEAVTIEFENIPTEALRFLEARLPVRPGAHVLHTTQHRLREKTWLKEHGFPVGDFAPIHTAAELDAAAERIGYPAVLKTAGFGYDGKGQYKLQGPDDRAAAWESLQGQPGILEAWIDFAGELSVVGARTTDGDFTAYGPIENRHHRHILDVSLYPATLGDPATHQAAVALTRAIMDVLGVTGLLCVELFLLQDPDGGNARLLVNELAPRPHNSGHLTIEACPTSQFEQQVRTLCGLPLGETVPLRPAAMANLLGDGWFSSGALREPDWPVVDSEPDAYLHLYGKAEARPGRKMGHVSVTAEDSAQAAEKALRLRNRLFKT